MTLGLLFNVYVGVFYVRERVQFGQHYTQMQGRSIGEIAINSPGRETTAV